MAHFSCRTLEWAGSSESPLFIHPQCAVHRQPAGGKVGSQRRSGLRASDLPRLKDRAPWRRAGSLPHPPRVCQRVGPPSFPWRRQSAETSPSVAGTRPRLRLRLRPQCGLDWPPAPRLRGGQSAATRQTAPARSVLRRGDRNGLRFPDERREELDRCRTSVQATITFRFSLRRSTGRSPLQKAVPGWGRTLLSAPLGLYCQCSQCGEQFVLKLRRRVVHSLDASFAKQFDEVLHAQIGHLSRLCQCQLGLFE